eukprot:CAMPEP_0171272638 /NCGR_PEP_ID=MMETSP0790-20130122/61865_1 /TAXON_ID=2925 /ORGANISM="Alexandrium catenella, Strain OF101" /LENGTH=44 /DNA_ID= /DNA_START= /DNA_END= /DNA_ORIENTATION=
MTAAFGTSAIHMPLYSDSQSLGVGFIAARMRCVGGSYPVATTTA